MIVGVMFRNNEHLVCPFFYFLRKSTDLPLKIVAVDQASTDTTNRELRKHLSGNDKLITLDKNLGCAGGRNIIIDASNGDDILFIDSDCFIIRASSIDAMNAVSSDVVFGRTLNFRNGEMDERGFCFCLVRGYVFEKVGKFNDRFQLFFDDTDFIDRTVLAGFERVGCEESLALHIPGSTITFGSEAERRMTALKHDVELYEKTRVLLT